MKAKLVEAQTAIFDCQAHGKFGCLCGFPCARPRSPVRARTRARARARAPVRAPARAPARAPPAPPGAKLSRMRSSKGSRQISATADYSCLTRIGGLRRAIFGLLGPSSAALLRERCR